MGGSSGKDAGSRWAQVKRCTQCGEVRPFAAFNRDSRRKDGRQARCADCRRAIRNYSAEAATQVDYQREWRRQWREANPEAAREQWRKYSRTDLLTQWRRSAA